MTYDSDGRLLTEHDPGGGQKQLSRASDPYNVTSTFTNQAGATSVYHTIVVSGTQNLQTAAMPDGATSQVLVLPDNTRSITYTDGTRAFVSQNSDPRWGAQVPINAQVIITTPAGLTSVITSSRQAALTYSRTLSSLVAQTDTINLNNNFYQSVYNVQAGAVTSTTPLGHRSVTNLDPQGRPLSQQFDPNLAPLTYQYDSHGRITRQQWGNISLSYAYNAQGLVASATDVAGDCANYAYDGAGRVVSMTSAVGSTYRFSYDANGNRTAVIMPSGAAHSLSYNALGLQTAYTPTNNAPYVTGYNAAGERTQVTMPDGRTETYTRDTGDRFNALSYPEASITVSYSDSTDRPTLITRTTVAGAAKSVAAPLTPATAGVTETLALAYDGSLITQTSWSGVASGSYRYHYNSDFLPTSIQLDNNGAMALQYNADDGIIRQDNFTINRAGPSGRASGITDNGPFSMTIGYDNLARINASHQRIGSNNRYDLQLSYHQTGRISHRVETISGTVSTYDYTYDPDGELLTVSLNGTAVERYTYDANGNRISRQLNGGAVETASYDAQDRLTAQGATSYSFDQNGFLHNRGADQFQYSTHGELLHAQLPSGRSVDYSYDGLERQVARTTISGTYQYLYGDPLNAFRLSAMRDPAGILTYYYYDERGILYALKQNGTIYYVASNQVGSPLLVTSYSSALVKQLSYDSFGDVTSDSNPGFYLPIGFAGGLRDVDTNLVRLGLRDYDPAIGRWTTRDPALYQGAQANLYVYAQNDPVGRTDPAGLFAVSLSAHAGVGGSVSIAIDSSGFSVSAGVGLGIGGGFGFDSGASHQSSSVKAVASASFAPGFFGAGADASIDLDGCTEANVGLNLVNAQGKVTYRGDTNQWTPSTSREIVYSGGANASASAQVVVTAGTEW